MTLHYRRYQLSCRFDPRTGVCSDVSLGSSDISQIGIRTGKTSVTVRRFTFVSGGIVQILTGVRFVDDCITFHGVSPGEWMSGRRPGRDSKLKEESHNRFTLMEYLRNTLNLMRCLHFMVLS